jgi:exoribonuclease R
MHSSTQFVEECRFKTDVRIYINDRTYTSWRFYKAKDFEEIDAEKQERFKTVNPLELKLFTNDLFVFDDSTNKIVSITSSVRSKTTIHSGVLQLESGKTYGRTLNKKRMFYKCIPDDIHLPAFLIPYETKMGFHKNIKNKYVTFHFESWDSKHPQGLLQEVLGDVDNLEAFYEYQLYCKSLNSSMKDMISKTNVVLSKQSHQDYIDEIRKNKNYNIVDRIKDYVFTIDPIGSVDFDDGFSICKLDNGRRKMSVYIANVSIWLDALGLWKSFSKRVSTIYLPDRKRPMLPTVLSDALCSLQEGQQRFAFVMDIVFDKDGSIAIGENGEPNITFSNAVIKVSKNYRYEESDLYNNLMFKEMIDLTQQIDGLLKDSHSLVSFWMIKMNSICAEMFYSKKNGIFRSVAFNEKPMTKPTEHLSEECRRVISQWNNTTGQYLFFKEGVKIDHDIMNLTSYIHITSPIRRLVDLLNQFLFAEMFTNTRYSIDASDFTKSWINDMDYINTSMRSIRKIQYNCELLHKCSNNPELLLTPYKGIVFDKLVKSDNSVSFMVYLEEWNLISRIRLPTNTNVDNFKEAYFKLFFFEDEDKSNKKIQLQLVE